MAGLGCAQEIIPSRPSDPSSIQVLLLGLPRTGAQTLAKALALLSIKPVYDMTAVTPNTHALLWTRALEVKADPDTPSWDRFKFDQMFSGYQAAGDYPASILAEDLAEAYPAAALILTTRSEDSWVQDVNQTLVRAQVERSPGDGKPADVLARAYHKHAWGDDFETNGRDVYRQHNEKVRKLAESRKFLEYQTEEGWGPLCEFLGVPVPDGEPFPLAEDGVE